MKNTKTSKTAKINSSKLLKLRNPDGPVPEWFTEIAKQIGGLGRGAGIDHARAYKNVAVLQPYDATGEGLLALLNICKERGFKVFVSGATNYYPSATFTICVYKSEHEAEMREFTTSSDLNIEVPTE